MVDASWVKETVRSVALIGWTLPAMGLALLLLAAACDGAGVTAASSLLSG